MLRLLFAITLAAAALPAEVPGDGGAEPERTGGVLEAEDERASDEKRPAATEFRIRLEPDTVRASRRPGRDPPRDTPLAIPGRCAKLPRDPGAGRRKGPRRDASSCSNFVTVGESS